jgi:hypothetical protein
MNEEQLIEEILIEARAYGLKKEVIDWAESNLSRNPSLSKLDAYVMAYHEWIN